MARIAIIGPGAVGGVMTAWLSRSGAHEVIVCARRPVADFTVETPQATIAVRPTVVTSPAEVSAVDFVLVATKAYDAAGAATWLPPLTAKGAPVAVFQNGVEHRERFAPYLPVERILPVLVYCPAERMQPDLIRQRRAARLVVEESAIGRGFAELFAGTAVEVSVTRDLASELWRKMCVNAPGALNAVLLQPNGIFHDAPIADIARLMIRECIAVGRAEGAVLDESVIESALDIYRKGAPDIMNSIHADRAAGRRMEIEARNGSVVRLGRKHGIATPCNQMVVALLEKMGVG